MANIKEFITDLNNMVLQGKPLEAFEKYYDDEIIMQENEQVPTIGKEANRKREFVFFDNITEFRDAHIVDVTYGESTTMVIWHYDYTHKEWGVRNYTRCPSKTGEMEKL